jgi:hypothetical protein
MSHYPTVIAKPDGTGFTGRQVHTADTPQYVIGLLGHLYRRPFHRDLDAMQAFLIDQHPGGWSQLGEDPNVDTGWNNDKPFRDGFVCYCHGDRHEVNAPFTQDSDATFVDWLYVIGPDGIDVSAADWGGSEDLDDDAAPTWRRLGRAGWGDEAGDRADLLAAVRHTDQGARP